MKDDAIYRQDAINAADRADYTGLAVEDVKKVTDEVVKELKQLPSAQPEQRWIPCTLDRMPSENDAYIVTCVGEGTKWTDVAEYSKRHKGWRYGLHSDNIIAWMPLPEPWEGDTQE